MSNTRMAKTRLQQISDEQLLALLQRDRALMDEVGEEFLFRPEVDDYGDEADQVSLQQELLNRTPPGVLLEDMELNQPVSGAQQLQQLIAAAAARGEI